MKIMVLEALSKKTGKIVSARGIHAESQYIKFNVPLELFTESELEAIKKDNCNRKAVIDETNKTITFSEATAFDLEEDYKNLIILIKEKEVSSITAAEFSKVLINNDYFDTTMSVLVAYRKDNLEILFAEGTGEDGRDHHILNIEYSTII